MKSYFCYVKARDVYSLLLITTITMPSLWATEKIKVKLISRLSGWFVRKGVDHEKWVQQTVKEMDDLDAG